MKKFRPALSFTLFTVISLAILVYLGTWQLQRLEWKRELITNIESAMNAVPVILMDTPEAYTRVKAVVSSAGGEGVCVFGANQAGDVGLYQFHPLRTKAGQVLFANLGWVAGKDKCPTASLKDEFTIVGMVRERVEPTTFTPVADIENRIWYAADTLAMAIPYEGLAINTYFLDSVLVEGESAAREALIRGKLSNNHLQYAFTWFGLAGSLIAVYIALGFKRGRKNT